MYFQRDIDSPEILFSNPKPEDWPLKERARTGKVLQYRHDQEESYHAQVCIRELLVS